MKSRISRRCAIAVLAASIVGSWQPSACAHESAGQGRAPNTDAAKAPADVDGLPYGRPLFDALVPASPFPPLQDAPRPIVRHVGLRTLVKNIGSDFRHLPSMSNLGAAIIGAGTALAAHQVDEDVNRRLYGRGYVHDFFLPGKIIGQTPVQVAFAVLVYGVGRGTKRPRAAHIGIDLLEAQAVTTVLTVGLKEAVRRERPDGSGHASFPSGHASISWATATVLARHFGWRAAVPTYLLASYVAASRLHENRHFLSDVVAGSTIGYIAGRTATRHGRTNFTLVPVFAPGQRALVVTRAW